MTYDPSSNDLLRAAREPSLAQLVAAAVAGGIAIGCTWYLAVAIRAGAL